ncbi:hypothetical protein NLX71_18600 [Paenibacillus sp. MZ04-78.2]|uniref:hypothetical protein n=1 Tax=Paenibacillus sp. MZ04-78.2 TaxID=2962034 RepID=UPI0020B73448|nr:hypothetical protein [Paenibacillus sp. MZ04-78.2]MCP3775285.1 hypothetical protein [Paenibacillus sp. MZ04-78.2]
MKKVIIIFGIIILVIICGVLINMFLPKIVSLERIAISDILNEEKEMTVKGTFTDSAIGFSGYNASSSEGKVFLEISGKFSLGKMDGNFSITLNKEKYGEPKEIYLKDGKNSVKIWPK